MGLRTSMVRRALARARTTDERARHLSALQAIGEDVAVEVPVRAVRTRTATEHGAAWVWPYWLERQTDPGSNSFVPQGPAPLLTNVTHRNWTMLGNVGSSARPIVDQRGLVTPWPDGWSLDWWIGAEDRWHFPSREVAVRQRLVDGAPVVETSVRVPSGDAVERVYAVSGVPLGNNTTGELLVVEFENCSPVPVALALAVRPYNPEGLVVVDRIALHDGRVVTVGGRPAVVLPRPPSAAAAGTFALGDVAGVVTRLATVPADQLAAIRCPAGMAQLALVYPLPHRALLRFALPLAAGGGKERRAMGRRRVVPLPEVSSVLPPAEAVARGWDSMVRRGMRLELPPGRLADAVEANRKFLLLFNSGRDVTPGPSVDRGFAFRDAFFLLTALDHYGFHDEVAEILRTYPSRQKRDGCFLGQRDGDDANGCALRAVAQHWRLTRDDALLRDLAPSIALGARWIQRRPSRLGRRDSCSSEAFWSIAGLRDAAELLAAAGDQRGAARSLDTAAAVMADANRSLGELGTEVAPLVACEPLHLLAPDDPTIVATVHAVRDRSCRGPAVYDSLAGTGLSTSLTLQLAAVELRQGDRVALERLHWLVDSATDTFTWPGAIHPGTTGGCQGDGHQGWVAAEFLNFVRRMLVRECDSGIATVEGEHPTGLELCAMLPDGWEGRPLEVHDAPTAVGRLSFVLRWHGNRPALLWDLAAHDGLGPVRLTAPGLDEAWSSTERRGEALLAAALADAVGGGEGAKADR